MFGVFWMFFSKEGEAFYAMEFSGYVRLLLLLSGSGPSQKLMCISLYPCEIHGAVCD